MSIEEVIKGYEYDVISTMDEGQLDGLPFGAIKLDASGKILQYNAAEASLTGRDPKLVIGKNFFTDVAPCTNVQEFAGAYRDGVAAGDLRQTFRYRFDFEMTPTDVTVTLFFDGRSQSGWVFVRA